jgi:DNA-binding transcriptional ArsR family regulator
MSAETSEPTALPGDRLTNANEGVIAAAENTSFETFSKRAFLGARDAWLAEVRRRTDLSQSTKNVAAAIAPRIWTFKGYALAKFVELAEAIGRSARTVRRAIKALVEAGLLHFERGCGRSRFRIAWGPEVAKNGHCQRPEMATANNNQTEPPGDRESAREAPPENPPPERPKARTSRLWQRQGRVEKTGSPRRPEILPASWLPEGSDLEAAEAAGLSSQEIQNEARKFSTYHFARPIDIARSWRSWLSRVGDFRMAQSRAPGAGPGGRNCSIADVLVWDRMQGQDTMAVSGWSEW